MERRCLAQGDDGERCIRACKDGSFFCEHDHHAVGNDFPIVNIYADRPYKLVQNDAAIDVAEELIGKEQVMIEMVLENTAAMDAH